MLRRLPGTRRHMQAKLAIGAVDDPLEHEADRAADQVMRMSDASVAFSDASPRLSRACAACEASADLHDDATPLVARAVAGGGRAMDTGTRGFMESRFGANFGDVRIHTGRQAEETAQTIGARAFTVGRDLVFAEGQYDANSAAGRHLIAHELAHTVQQGAAGPAVVARTPDRTGVEISAGVAPIVQRVGECDGYKKSDCRGQACIPNSGKGTGYCGWSGTIKNGCICIPIESTIVDLIKAVILPALIALGITVAAGVVIAVVACFISGACEVGAVIAALGFAGAMLVVGLLKGGSGGGATADPGAPSAANPATEAQAGTPGPAPPAAQPA